MAFGGLFVKPLHQSFFPDHTILAMFFQSSKIRKVTTDLPDGKHMSGGRPRQGDSHTNEASSGSISENCFSLSGCQMSS